MAFPPVLILSTVLQLGCSLSSTWQAFSSDSAGRLKLFERNIALAQTRFRITPQCGRDRAGRSGQLGVIFNSLTMSAQNPLVPIAITERTSRDVSKVPFPDIAPSRVYDGRSCAQRF